MCVRRVLCEKTAEKKAKTEGIEEAAKAGKTKETEKSARRNAGQNGEKLCLKTLS